MVLKFNWYTQSAGLAPVLTVLRKGKDTQKGCPRWDAALGQQNENRRASTKNTFTNDNTPLTTVCQFLVPCSAH
jgi:hypothetical protein